MKTAFRRFGFDIIQFHPESSDAAKISLVLRHLSTDLVLDVGANEGQYGQSLREMGYRGRIVSFEPLTTAHALLRKAASGDAQWIVHDRCAIGDRDGEVSINIAGNSFSSSLLPLLPEHASAAPNSVYVGAETVLISRLDAVAMPYLQGMRSGLLKIDTQGYESAVLRGAGSVLRVARAVQLEMSLVPLYEGQELWEFFVREMARQGFEVWTVLPGFVDDGNGRTLQMDVIFVRP